jgi:hypothetical protein
VLFSYCGAAGYYRPACDIFVVGPGNRIDRVRAPIDSASDYTILAASAASTLGLTLPFPRLAGVSAAGGSQAATFSFPPVGLVSLFVTDYREYAFLPGPLVGFHPPGPGAANQRSVMGLTGFLQFFRFILDHEASPPMFELHPITNFPGQGGLLPLDRGLNDFIRGLRAIP